MSRVWLDVHYRDQGFDVLVDDTDRTSLMDLYEFMFEDSVKQNVILPKYFSLYLLPPRTNRKLELCGDRDMLKMWEWFLGKETIVIYLEEEQTPKQVFKDALGNWQRRVKAMAEKARLDQEKAQAERELEEQQPFKVAVEVPVANVDDGDLQYVRVFGTQEADEVFPGASQPEPEQSTQPSTPPKQPQPTSPLNQPKTSCPRRKINPKKRKRTPKKRSTETTQPSPQPETTPPPQPPSSQLQTTPPPQPPSPQPQPTPPPQPPVSNQPQTTIPPESSAAATCSKQKKGGRSRPEGFRSKKSAEKKVTSEGQGVNLRRSDRNRARNKAPEIEERSDEFGSDSEDDDYIQSDSEEVEDDYEADIGDFIEEETDIDCLYDDIPEKQFEDYLDGSSTMDKTYKNGKIWTYQEFGAIRLEPWLIFGDRESFIEVFKDYCIQEGFGVYVEKTDKTRYIARCAVDGCNWRIHASTMTDKVSWAIKTLTGEHKSCRRLEINPVVTSEWLCRHLQSDILANRDIPVESLQRLCMERFRIEVKKRLFYKVKAMCKERIHGGFGEAYSLLPKYAEMVKETNPGSYALVTWGESNANEPPRFKSCFFSFAAQCRGFLRGCRPIIGIDGAHLSGHFKGILVTAVGIDGNNEIFLIAYGVVGTESIDSWGYFLGNLKILFEKEGCSRDDWTFISDRMKGVDTAIHETFPRATRRVCCQHLYTSCKAKGFSGSAFHKLFWIAADAYNEYVFNKAMKKILEYNPKAVEYLESCTEVWSRHKFDPALCCDHNTTNFVESFNSCTQPYRDLPVLKLLEAIRQWAMKRIGSRFDKAIGMGDMDLTEYATKILQARSHESRLCYATPCGGDEFEVRDQHVHFPIKLSRGTCGCGKWQLSGIPCKHVLRVIYHQRLQPTNFVAPCFKGKAYKLTYAEHMHPMPDPSQWPSVNLPHILPPLVKKSAGRPKKKRRRGSNEARKGNRHSTVKCSLCGELGHNMLTCASKKKNSTNEASTSKRAATRMDNNSPF